MPVSSQIVQWAWFLGYLALSGAAILGLIAVATSRSYYFHLVPFIAGYAVLAAAALVLLGLGDFVWWAVAFLSFGLLLGLNAHLRSPAGVAAFAQLEERVLAEITDDDIKQQVAEELAPKRAITQDVVVSVAAFAVVYVASAYLLDRVI